MVLTKSWRYLRSPLIVTGVLSGLLVFATRGQSQVAGFSAAASEVAAAVAAAFPPTQGTIVQVREGQLLLDVGQKSGVYPGLEMEAFRPGEEFTHPLTGQPLGRLDKILGRIRLKEVQEALSTAEAVTLTPEVTLAVGDRVRVSGARILVALPLVDPGEVGEVNVQTLTRDLALALAKTGRFEVSRERQLRDILLQAKVPSPDDFSDPATLKILSEKGRLPVLLLAKLSPLRGGLFLDVQVISTSTGNTLTIKSAEIKGVEPRLRTSPEASASPRALPASPPRPLPPPSAERGGPDSGFILTPLPGEMKREGFLEGPDFREEMRALALADLDGTGVNSLIVASVRQVFIYTFDGKNFRLAWESPAERASSIIGLDAADITGDGRAEIFVTRYYGSELRSFVLERRGKEMVTVWDKAPLFFRVLPLDREAAPVLVAQRLGTRDPFSEPILRYKWDGTSYVPGAPLGVPRGTGVYGLAVADLNGDGSPETVTLSSKDTLKVYSTSGELLSESSDHFGGSEKFIRYLQAGSGSRAEDDQADTITIQPRLLLRPAGAAGEKPGSSRPPEILLPYNIPSTSYIFGPASRFYTKGRVVGITWDGEGFVKRWETKEVEGVIADLALGPLGPRGENFLVVLVSKSGLTSSRGRVLAQQVPE